MKKYKILPKNWSTETFPMYKIQALKSFGDIKKGDLGGYIQSENNLSHKGNCWVYKGGQISEDCRVYGNVRIYSGGRVYGAAKVFGDVVINGGSIYGNAKVSGNVRVNDWACVFGYAKVSGNVILSDNAQISGYARAEKKAVLRGSCSVSGYAVISGGIIKDKAVVEREGRVSGAAQVGGRAIIKGRSRVSANSIIIDSAIINGATIGDTAIIKDEAVINEGCSVEGDAVISSNIEYLGGAISTKSPIVVSSKNWRIIIVDNGIIAKECMFEGFITTEKLCDNKEGFLYKHISLLLPLIKQYQKITKLRRKK